jgi:hypothetical protein
VNGHSVGIVVPALFAQGVISLITGSNFMDLDEAFRNHKEKIVDKWVEYTLSTYSSSGFFLRERDRFANPIGGNVREALAGLFTLLAQSGDVKEMMAPLEQLISIRAVQEFSPSQAVAPLNAVKHITREVLPQTRSASIWFKNCMISSSLSIWQCSPPLISI